MTGGWRRLIAFGGLITMVGLTAAIPAAPATFARSTTTSSAGTLSAEPIPTTPVPVRTGHADRLAPGLTTATPPPSDLITASPSAAAPRSTTKAPAKTGPCPAPSTGSIGRAPGPGRTVALTFDDGPSAVTPELLDLLARKHVHATFFMIGSQVRARPQVAARVATDGHLVGDHTYHHRYPQAVKGGWTAPYLRSELSSTRQAIAEAGAGPVCWFRPPGGYTSPEVFSTAQGLGLQVALWSVDPQDWKLQGLDSATPTRPRRELAQQIARGAEDGLTQQHPVILLHDGGGHREATVTAVSSIIDTYRAHGYRFVRLDGRP